MSQPVEWGYNEPIEGNSEYPPEGVTVGPIDTDEVICYMNPDLPRADAIRYAKLIAAAPKMRAMLERVLQICKNPRASSQAVALDDLWPELKKLLAELDEKPEGGAQ